MNKLFKILGLALLLSFGVIACNNGTEKDCAEDCKKECCDKKECDKKDKKECKDKKDCAADCEKECCADKDRKECAADCEKECCADKSESTDSTEVEPAKVEGDEQAHTCGDECKANPDSCPHHG